ncbi:MAG: thermonuclease family protein [Aestuariivita sp.]|nr:thermonuclease family protein [Aestuariivita sp.]
MEILFSFALLALIFVIRVIGKKSRCIISREETNKIPAVISGAAFIIDGDGLRVNGYNIRMAGLDAPEYDQPAQDLNGKWFNQGKKVKSHLIQKIGGKTVEIQTHGRDKYGRVLGTVFCNGENINKWLVLRGFATAAYGRQYRAAEKWSQQKRLGMWELNQKYDPREWRQRVKSLNSIK